MHRIKRFALLSLTVLLAAVFCLTSLAAAAPAPAGDHLAVSGLVTNPMGTGLKEVAVEVLVNGQHVKPTGQEAEIVTGKPGGYVADFLLPAGTLPAAKVEVQAAKPSWKPIPATPVKVVDAGVDAQGNKLFQAVQNLTLNRTTSAGFWIASIILLLVYVVISLELMHRTLIAFLGAALILRCLPDRLPGPGPTRARRTPRQEHGSDVVQEGGNDCGYYLEDEGKHWQKYLAVTILMAVFLMVFACPWSLQAAQPQAGDSLTVSGVVEDAQGKGVKEVELEVLVNGKAVTPAEDERLDTGSKGGFIGRYRLPQGTLPGAQVQILAMKPSWQTQESGLVQVLEAGADKSGNRVFQAQTTLTLKRQITPAFWIAAVVLLLVYLLIAAELMHRTLAAFLGGAFILFISYTAGTFDRHYFILSFHDAMRAIDLNVIFLLMGMMIIVGVLKKTGLFQWMAYKSYALARGNIFILALILQVVTAVTSAFLDNVTTMLLLIPVTIEIAVTLKINPLTLLIPEVFASNVGGCATLIGDPPNILIGSFAKLTFSQFVTNLALVCIVCLILTSLWYLWWYKKGYLAAEVKDVDRTIAYLKEEYRITNKKLTVMGLGILAFVIFLFVIHGVLHMEPSVAALIGAMVLLAISRVDIVEMLEHEVEWPTLVFFMALFMVIAGAEETGLIQVIAEWVKDVSRGNLTMAIILVLWVSAIASAFIDNIPFTATMLPIIAFLNVTIPGAESGVLWWALALGACLGGNGTMIGASANVVTVGLAEKAGYHISFLYYMKACWWPMMITVAISMGYLLIAY